jgi:hypothetical protein
MGCCGWLQARNPYEEGQKITKIRKVYQRSIVLPIVNVELLWRDYDQFEHKLNKALVPTPLQTQTLSHAALWCFIVITFCCLLCVFVCGVANAQAKGLLSEYITRFTLAKACCRERKVSTSNHSLIGVDQSHFLTCECVSVCICFVVFSAAPTAFFLTCCMFWGG